MFIVTQKEKKVGMLIITLFAIAILTTTLFSGCTENKPAGTTATLSLGGSTTVQPIADACAQAFMVLHSNITVQVYGGGSGVGIKGVAGGTYDIGDASREAKASDLTDIQGVTLSDLVAHKIALDGIAIIVSKEIYNAGVTNISKTQLKGIYNRTITNWQTLGGPNEAIFVVGRDTSSGTYTSINDMLGLNQSTQILDVARSENAQVKAAVAGQNNGIGYVGLGFVDANTPAVKLNGISPSISTVTDNTYPLSRSLYMYTKGPASGVEQMFIDFVLSTDGQKIVEQEEFVPLPK
ncbi:PBP superfamily domain protein [uncultured archaeon]|nr:PBP superfamily domain protein [uncultured archaeon]